MLCFVSRYLSVSCLVLVAYNKTNIRCLFCLISKLFTLDNINIQFRFASLNIKCLGWLISDIKQNGMEYLLIINTILHNMLCIKYHISYMFIYIHPCVFIIFIHTLYTYTHIRIYVNKLHSHIDHHKSPRVSLQV